MSDQCKFEFKMTRRAFLEGSVAMGASLTLIGLFDRLTAEAGGVKTFDSAVQPHFALKNHRRASCFFHPPAKSYWLWR